MKRRKIPSEQLYRWIHGSAYLVGAEVRLDEGSVAVMTPETEQGSNFAQTTNLADPLDSALEFSGSLNAVQTAPVDHEVVAAQVSTLSELGDESGPFTILEAEQRWLGLPDFACR